MTGMHRYALAACVALTASCAVSARAQALPERIAKTQVIRVSVNAIYPPLEFKDPASGQLIGFDIDLGEALAKELGVSFEWQESAYEQLFPALATGRADMILSGINDSPVRRESVDFIDYLTTSAQFYALAPRADLTSADALCGKTVGTSRASSFPPKVKAWSDEHCVAAGKPPITIEGTTDNAIARAELKQARFDAAVQGNETLPYIMSLEPHTYRLVGTPFAGLYQGIAFRKDGGQLRGAVLAAFKALIANGTYAKIVARWHLQADAVSQAAINGEAVR
ncbi:ABC transporter substrate-binding protein [Paraburkholderia sp.]|uniref:ABC transporter substrate-binding protein n=1 Tax=Paraburkholderia sp. TaxID=1926495 RepID=UPI0039E5A13B